MYRQSLIPGFVLAGIACAAAQAPAPHPSIVNVAAASSARAPADAGSDAAAVGEPADLQVVLVVNARVAGANRVGARLGPVVRRIPQWAALVEGAGFDLSAHADWVMVTGPSLLYTGRDVIVVHLDAPPAAIDGAIETLARRSAPGGPFDAGGAGTTAFTAHLDGADRVLLRSGSVLAVLPSAVAAREAGHLRDAVRSVAEQRPNVAAFLHLREPWRAFPVLPHAIDELRAHVETRPDQGADLVVDCETADAATASETSDALRAFLGGLNSSAVELLTGGLLDAPDFAIDGRTVSVKLSATEEMLEKLFELADATLR